jgi:ABC-type molybdate transport system ATPase subunit
VGGIGEAAKAIKSTYSSDDHRPVFGRERELSLLSESMRHSGPRVTHVHGISGIGKSALILAFATIWRSKRRTLLLDGRTIEPIESGFQLELSPLDDGGAR